MKNLEAQVEAAEQAIDAAGDESTLDQIRVQYLGKKGILTQQLKLLGQLSVVQRPAAGARINEAKQVGSASSAPPS